MARSGVMQSLLLLLAFSFLSCINRVSSLRYLQQLSPTTASSPVKDATASDRLSLLSFKSMVSEDPTGALASWNHSLPHCQWHGISCSRRHPGRVTALDLSSLELAGPLSPALGNLTFLARMDLSNNGFHGRIPPELGELIRLRHLNLSVNSLQGGIFQLGNIIDTRVNSYSSLAYINLARNILSGNIPPSIGNLSSLYHLDLSFNAFSGSIPATIGNLLSLEFLDLQYNNLSGVIPPSLGKLSALSSLGLCFNGLSGDIPHSLWNLSSLEVLDLDSNSLSGSLPSHLGHTFPRLWFFSIAHCKLHGPIPASLSNASALYLIQLHGNMFSGIIPSDLGNLKYLSSLLLYDNHLDAVEPKDWSFLTALANCTELRNLALHRNNLGGVLPNSIANLSTTLQLLNMQENHISGSLPPEIGNLVGLTAIFMAKNLLAGPMPASIGMLPVLDCLDVGFNSLSGEIPLSLQNLTRLNELYLDSNNLTGTIPSNLEYCQYLYTLDLGYNSLTGFIPQELFTISALSKLLDLSHNSLTGPLPSEVGSLENLEILDISDNRLSGGIPTSLGRCQVLRTLNMGHNFFEGAIPSSLSALRGIQMLNLSHNNLSGSVPNVLKDVRGLYFLDLSFNNFEGEMPRGGVFDNTSAVSVLGNNELCGGNPALHLRPCQLHETTKKHTSLKVVIISVASVGLFSFLLFCLLAVRYLIQNSRGRSLATIEKEGQHVKVSYAELVRSTNGFSTSNLIGKGGFGSVYKGILNENIVAVKVFNLQQQGAAKSFLAECEALRNIRHRNLVKIVTACSSVDFRGNDFKAMVFELMANGSLESWLHPESNNQARPKKLNLLQRLNIALDVASALEYLHHHGDTPIVHCDLKPSNVLLDDEMTARVSDFGLARFLNEAAIESSQTPVSSIGVKGTIGYVAPEYGMGIRTTTQGDVYSYGILLLQMLTGKRPTDDTFKDGQSLHSFVKTAISGQVMDAMDPQLLFEEEDVEVHDDARVLEETTTLECVASLLRIGLRCSSELPMERMEMGDVTRELHMLKNVFQRTRNN